MLTDQRQGQSVSGLCFDAFNEKTGSVLLTIILSTTTSGVFFTPFTTHGIVSLPNMCLFSNLGVVYLVVKQSFISLSPVTALNKTNRKHSPSGLAFTTQRKVQIPHAMKLYILHFPRLCLTKYSALIDAVIVIALVFGVTFVSLGQHEHNGSPVRWPHDNIKA